MAPILRQYFVIYDMQPLRMTNLKCEASGFSHSGAKLARLCIYYVYYMFTVVLNFPSICVHIICARGISCPDLLDINVVCIDSAFHCYTFILLLFVFTLTIIVCLCCSETFPEVPKKKKCPTPTKTKKDGKAETEGDKSKETKGCYYFFIYCES